MGDLIRTTAELGEACGRARADGVLSLDTEFVWMRTYRPQLGIVQMGCREGCWAIDCLTGLDTSALKALIEDEDVVKILHDARQDLTHLHHWTGACPQNVFDTQLAAAFAGFSHGIGLQKLLFEAIGVGLPKTETRTDWLQRPLSDAQVRYALDDVRYLPVLRDELVRRCVESGTQLWMLEDQVRYDEAALYVDYDPENVWQRVKTRHVRLDGRGRSVLRAVAALREELAQKWNLPRTWLGDDASLVQMAAEGRVGHLVHRLRGGQGDTIRGLYAETVKTALVTPEAEWPEDPRRHYIDEVLDAADAALAWLNEKAKALHVDSQAIANRATVTAFVDDVTDVSNSLASGWRYETVGKELAERFGVD